MSLLDTHGRTHDYLRISLTDNCNLRCFYCMPEEDYDFTPASRLMQAHEVVALAKTFVELGVKKIRLTGGEPLVRKDAAAIIEALGQLPVELTLTTNGTRIEALMPALETAGIRSLNISLDTLDREKFLFMTRRDQYETVRMGIQHLLDKDIKVKVNAVVMKDLNDDELLDFVEWTRTEPVHVRFIEFMPFEGNKWSSNQVVTEAEILGKIAKKYEFDALLRHPSDTAKAFQAKGHAGTFALISTMSAPFCDGCNRIRLTADGKLKNCLFSKGETDLLTPLRAGEDVEPLIRATVLAKAKALGGQFGEDWANLDTRSLDNRSMITIGG